MSLLSFFGCGLTAYGPIITLFLLTISNNAQLVILAMTSAFFWLFSLLLTAILWFVIKPWQEIHSATLLYSILIQELIRWLYFKLIVRAEKGLHITANNPKSPYNRAIFAYASGIGVGLMYALMTYIAILAQSSGPGVILAPACPNVSLFFLNAIMTFMQSITHVAWMMIAFDGYYTPISAWRIGFVILTHFTTAYATTLNHPDVSLGCIYPLVINGLVMLTSVGLAARRVFRNS